MVPFVLPVVGLVLVVAQIVYGDAPQAPEVAISFQVADVDIGVINWVNADLVTHIITRV